MADRTEYAPGTPSWVDLAAPDLDAAKSFYGDLFGWEAQSAGPEDQVGDYSFFTLNGKAVCGVGSPGEGEPASWRTYFSVADADEAAEKVKKADGEVLFGPTDVVDAGRVATFRDTEGAVFGVWQPGEHKGAQLINEPGALAWNELATRDPEAAKSFYGSVFGWDMVDRDVGDITYIELQLEGRRVGGMLPLTDEAPEDVSPHWLAYFAVEDFEGAVSKAEELGGEVAAPESDSPSGPFAVLNDPNGAGFAVIEPLPEEEREQPDEDEEDDGADEEEGERSDEQEDEDRSDEQKDEDRSDEKQDESDRDDEN